MDIHEKGGGRALPRLHSREKKPLRGGNTPKGEIKGERGLGGLVSMAIKLLFDNHIPNADEFANLSINPSFLPQGNRRRLGLLNPSNEIEK